MKKKTVNIFFKFCILLVMVYLLMSTNNGDIEYIYANF
jgi:hypothetical protein